MRASNGNKNWAKKHTRRRTKLTALPLRVAAQRFLAQHCRVREFHVPFRIDRCEHVFAVRRFGTDGEGSISVDNAATMCFREFWALHWSGKSHLVATAYEDDEQNQPSFWWAKSVKFSRRSSNKSVTIVPEKRITRWILLRRHTTGIVICILYNTCCSCPSEHYRPRHARQKDKALRGIVAFCDSLKFLMSTYFKLNKSKYCSNRKSQILAPLDSAYSKWQGRGIFLIVSFKVKIRVILLETKVRACACVCLWWGSNT